MEVFYWTKILNKNLVSKNEQFARLWSLERPITTLYIFDIFKIGLLVFKVCESHI